MTMEEKANPPTISKGATCELQEAITPLIFFELNIDYNN